MATEERAKRLRGTCEFLNDEFRDGYEKGLHDGCFMGAHLQKKIDIDKACEFFAAYLAEIGYPDDWCRDSEVQKSGEQRFREFMEE